MDRPALHRPGAPRTPAAPSAAALSLAGEPGRGSGWRRWLPGRDLVLAWLAAVAAVTVILDFAATF